MSNPKEIASQFVKHYYSTFDANRAALGSLYVSIVKSSFRTPPICIVGPMTEGAKERSGSGQVVKA